ncbi:hypothetical protein [Helicobacter pylori]|uniref:hypothetical protein n=1 Tax=Helicobacter pylori TaxID=210 RepID=UPI000FDF5BE1|nr:hypothetical protein [Helicobacter pylori]RVY43492.1 hypothetical protein ECC27_06405 [Helicobacter pylori]
MIIRFDHNNNSGEWQMLFNKINNGSPFGVITFIGPILSHFENVMRSGYLSSEPTKQDQIRSFLINKREFIGFVEIIIGPSESLFFVYENEPSATFNLKNYLLVLAKIHCVIQQAICYCENKQDAQNTDTKEIKFLRTRTHFFGKEFGSTKVKIGISNPKTFWDSLLELRNEFYSFVLDENPIEDYKDFLIKNKKIINDRISITLYPHNDCFVDNKYSSSDFRINSTFEKHMEDIKSHYKRFRETFLKIQSILKSCVRKGFYIIQNKTIVNILTPKSLEMQLLQKLSQNKADLSNHIIEVLNYQLSFQPHQPPIITYALIRKIRYNFNYNTFHFIFDIVNFLDEKLEFIIEVPREALDLENIDRLVEKNHSHGSLARHVREGSFILDTHLKE